MLPLDDMGEEGGIQGGPKLDDVINEQPLTLPSIKKNTVFLTFQM